MARQIAPGTPPTIEAQQIKTTLPDFKKLDDMGDAKIKAANTNFTLYANTLIQTESAKLYEKYKNDPIQLSNALGKLPEMLKDLPQEIQDTMNEKLYLNGVALVQKAEQNRLITTDLQNKQLSATSADNSKWLMAQEYQNILRNNISKPEDRRTVSNDIFLQQQMNLNSIADLQDHNGQNVYSETQRKAIRNIDDLELEGFKQFFDGMLLNDNDKLEQSKDYYTKFMLAPERFMAENYMNRATYDKAIAYAKKELDRAGAEIKKEKFNQSVKEYTELQISDLPGRIESLKESGMINDELIKSINNVNVKFDKIDPSKTESPVAMLDLLKLVNESKGNPAPKTEAEQQKILEQGTATLDAIAEYAQEYGLSPEKVKSIREAVVNWETNAAFAPIIENFNDIIDNFGALSTVRRKSTGKDKGKYITGLDGLSVEDERKFIDLNNILAVATDTINQQIRNGDWDGVRQTQRDVQKRVARLKYDWVNWDEIDANPDQTIVAPNGRAFTFKGYTLNGDIIVEVLQ